MQRLQRCYQLNKHLTIQYSSKRKSNNVRFTDNKESCFPLETLEINLNPDTRKGFLSWELWSPVGLVQSIYMKTVFKMPRQCKESLPSENYWFVGHCSNIWLFRNLFTYIQPKSVDRMFFFYITIGIVNISSEGQCKTINC